MYQLIVENRQFAFYHFDSSEPERSNPRLNALSIETHKLFSNDVLDHTGDLIYSYIRAGELIPGVLILNGNRTYGKNETGKRALYKCIPDNRELPPFLVPYELKLGFSKDIKNKYVVIKYDHWNDKHPRGVITETIGDVNLMSAYYEYRLYCRNIHDSISEFTSKVRELTKDREGTYASVRSDTRFHIESRLNVPVYSIDPEGCTDIDDAFSIQTLIGEPGYKISIYIANVYVWIETLGLWEYIANRVSTIYLPDKRRTMLPTILSENLCSLLKHQSRFAFCMDVFVNPDGDTLRKPEFSNVEISLHSNFAYDEPRLLSNPNCKAFMDITRKMDPTIGDTHELIEYWMIYMNSRCGERLALAKDGIFRTATINENTTNKLRNIIRNWNDVNCKYSTYSDDADISHQVLNIGAYVHITSPIRRLVDILNQTMFIKRMGICEISPAAERFTENWKQKIKYINDKTKSIRKTQNECELMTLPAEIFEREHNGVLFGKKLLDNDIYQYSIYVENLKTFGKIKTNIDLPDYSEAKFKLYYFGDEYDSKRKLKFLIRGTDGSP
jgi:exoribonuclease R